MTSSDIGGTPVKGATTISPAHVCVPECKPDSHIASPPSPQDPYAPTSWGVYDEELVCPSGQKCRVRKLDFAEVLNSGMLDTLNTLQGAVDKNVKKGQGQPPIDPMKLLKNKKTTTQFSDVLNEVAALVVTAPKVEIPPAKFEDRKEGVVYADTIGFVDKMHIFEKAMGSVKELEAFRIGSGEGTERVADEPGDALPS